MPRSAVKTKTLLIGSRQSGKEVTTDDTTDATTTASNNTINSNVIQVPDSKNSFYINIELTKDGKKNILEKTMQEETGLPRYMAGVVAGFADKVVHSETIIDDIAKELVTGLPPEVETAGIRLDLKKRFVKKNLVVLHARVLRVDLDRCVQQEYGDEGARHFQNLMAAMDFFKVTEEKQSVVEEIVDEVVTELMKEMQNSIPEEFAKEGIECVVEVVSEKEQANVLLSKLEKQESDEKEKKRTLSCG